MKNLLLFTALVASLGLNAWLALARPAFPAAADAAANSRAAGATATSVAQTPATEVKAGGSPRPMVWNAPSASNDDLRAVAANLRAAGFPPNVIAKIVGTMLRDRAYAKVAELPFWQLNSNSRETRKLQAEAGRELLRLQEEILGASGSQLATLDPNQRLERFGDLPDEKVAALLRIDRDYQDMMMDLAPSGMMTQQESAALRAQFAALEKERLADIKAALGAEAYANYERQSSGIASTVMRGLRELKVTEEEYNALFAAQKTRSPDESTAFSIIDLDAPTSATTYAFNDQVRAILGEERAHAFLKSADPVYGQVARFTDQQQGIAPATVYQLYQLQNEARTAMRQAMPRDGAGGSVDVEKMRQTFADLNARLDALVGPEVAKAFRANSAGSAFRNFAPRPAPTSNAASAPPKG